LQNRHRWADLEFPDVFGRRRTKEERFIEELDEKTGASLKLTLLNPEGRIWNLVAGGGASVIFADTVADLGYGNLLVCAIVRLCDCAIVRLCDCAIVRLCDWSIGSIRVMRIGTEYLEQRACGGSITGQLW
jgi:hypothetical protein